MSAKVIEFQPRDPHLSGMAGCAVCRYTWAAVIPVGSGPWFECPNCHSMKGLFTHPILLPDAVALWTCKCGCDVFRVTTNAIFCITCGLIQGD